MQHDEVIWQVINQGFCSFKVKLETQSFCKNKYNVTGLCNRSSCPLANSRYATIIEDQGVCYLYIKTIERAHSPKNLWEKIKLSRNYAQALEQINQQLMYWPNFLQHKCKQRLTKIHQYLIRMRKLRLKIRPKLVGIHKKVERREKRREAKAFKAARLEDAIKQELIARLKTGTYGELYAPPETYAEALDELGEVDEEPELDADLDAEDEKEMDEEESEMEHEFVEEYDADIMGEDMEDFEDPTAQGDDSSEDDRPAPRRGRRRGGRGVELEYEEEREPAAVSAVH